MTRTNGWPDIPPAAAAALRRRFRSPPLPDVGFALHRGPVTRLRRRVLVVSPHLDDAIFSLGATIARHGRTGGQTTILTVFAGDTASAAPAGEWDRRAGFSTAGQAALVRRQEDRSACGILDARCVQLAEEDEQYTAARRDDRISEALNDLAGCHDEVLVPGYPLWHADHTYVTHVALARLRGVRVRLYAEEPYTSWSRRSPTLGHPAEAGPPHTLSTWGTGPTDWNDRIRKVRAAAQYRSQLPLLAAPAWRGPLGDRGAALLGLLWWEARDRGELVSNVVAPGQRILGDGQAGPQT
jgi:LmbE family N-acetylglucosaminyl deacetylase